MVELLRRRRLREKYAALWIVVAVVVLRRRDLPADHRSGWPSWSASPRRSTCVFFLGLLVLLVVCVQLSAEVSGLEHENQTLAEESALLRNRIEVLERHVGLGRQRAARRRPRLAVAARPDDRRRRRARTGGGGGPGPGRVRPRRARARGLRAVAPTASSGRRARRSGPELFAPLVGRCGRCSTRSASVCSCRSSRSSAAPPPPAGRRAGEPAGRRRPCCGSARRRCGRRWSVRRSRRQPAARLAAARRPPRARAAPGARAGRHGLRRTRCAACWPATGGSATTAPSSPSTGSCGSAAAAALAAVGCAGPGGLRAGARRGARARGRWSPRRAAAGSWSLPARTSCAPRWSARWPSCWSRRSRSQLLANAGPLIVQVLAPPAEQALTGKFLAALVIARVPVFLFAAVQAVLLPGLAGLVGAGDARGLRPTARARHGLTAAIAAVGVLVMWLWGDALVGALVRRRVRGRAATSSAHRGLGRAVHAGAAVRAGAPRARRATRGWSSAGARGWSLSCSRASRTARSRGSPRWPSSPDRASRSRCSPARSSSAPCGGDVTVPRRRCSVAEPPVVDVVMLAFGDEPYLGRGARRRPRLGGRRRPARARRQRLHARRRRRAVRGPRRDAAATGPQPRLHRRRQPRRARGAGQYLALVNSDAIVEPDALAVLVAVASRPDGRHRQRATSGSPTTRRR